MSRRKLFPRQLLKREDPGSPPGSYLKVYASALAGLRSGDKGDKVKQRLGSRLQIAFLFIHGGLQGLIRFAQHKPIPRSETIVTLWRRSKVENCCHLKEQHYTYSQNSRQKYKFHFQRLQSEIMPKPLVSRRKTTEMTEATQSGPPSCFTSKQRFGLARLHCCN